MAYIISKSPSKPVQPLVLILRHPPNFVGSLLSTYYSAVAGASVSDAASSASVSVDVLG